MYSWIERWGRTFGVGWWARCKKVEPRRSVFPARTQRRQYMITVTKIRTRRGTGYMIEHIGRSWGVDG